MNDFTTSLPALTEEREDPEVIRYRAEMERPLHRKTRKQQLAITTWRYLCYTLTAFFAVEALVALLASLLHPEELQSFQNAADLALALAVLSLAGIGFMPGWWTRLFEEVC